MNESEIVATLQDLRFLQDVPQEELVELAKFALLRDFKPSDVVFREGTVAEEVYLVVSGNVSLEICASGIGCKRILTVGPGEILGWSGLLGNVRLTATARAISPTRLVELDAAQLLAACERDPKFGYTFMRRTLFALTERLSATRIQLLNIFGAESTP